jgi:ATP-dependent Zn protease
MKIFTDLAVSAFPMLILLGFWWYFMRRYRGTQQKQIEHSAQVKDYLGEYLAETRRLNETLDRIAKALEKTDAR